MNFDAASAIETLDFPELIAIERSLRIYRVDLLTTMNFPKLQQVLENVTVEGTNASGMPNIQSIAFPELTAVGGTFTLYYISGAGSFTANKLETASGFTIYSCSAFASINLPALKKVNGSLFMSTLAALTELQFSKLTTVDGTLQLLLAALTSLQLPALTTVDGTLQLRLPLLTSLNGLLSLRKVDIFYADDLRGITEIDVRDIAEIGTLRLANNTLRYTSGITLVGNETFPGNLILELPSMGSTPFAEFPITVEGIRVVGGLEHVPSSNGATIEAINFPWLERVTGLLNLHYSTRLTTISLPNLKSVGGLRLGQLAGLTTLELPELKEITGYTSGTTTTYGFDLIAVGVLTAFELPKLERIEGELRITYTSTASSPLATVSLPKLGSISGTFNIVTTITAQGNTFFKDLSGFSALTSAAGVSISGFRDLKNFCPLNTVASTLDADDKWSIANCGYNPTHEQMMNGNCSN
jgi:hypothetical protein